MVGRKKIPVVQRFLEYVEIHPDGCWLWKGSLNEHGYGIFGVGTPPNRKMHKAHRFSYELFVGPISDGLEPDHLCRNHPCINPEHLEPVTHKENQLRSMSVSGINARKTHCSKGHAFTLENTYKHGNSRHCKTCRAEKDKTRSEYFTAYRAKKKQGAAV